jgi:hypothetical protein
MASIVDYNNEHDAPETESCCYFLHAHLSCREIGSISFDLDFIDWTCGENDQVGRLILQTRSIAGSW